MAALPGKPVGPSPRLRGKRRRHGEIVEADGSIPAPAGETSDGRRMTSRASVHPRACGGNNSGSSSLRRWPGPSPRLRGKRRMVRPASVNAGSIPAPAGETLTGMATILEGEVHPRACGGNTDWVTGATNPTGPSPRLRGKLRPRAGGWPSQGSIPAPAGETSGKLVGRLNPQVHPRACGGNGSGIESLTRIFGPSPRLRGKRGLRCGKQGRGRSIPAPAGETSLGASGARPQSVHPRACGGNPERRVEDAAQGGPSPRLRGKHDRRPFVALTVRSIPAPAGETSCRNRRRARQEVHPRACGGNADRGADAPLVRGPSPRLRGKLE